MLRLVSVRKAMTVSGVGMVIKILLIPNSLTAAILFWTSSTGVFRE